MKKNLIALAVLAASGVASAQSTVTLYGLVDAYVGSFKTKTSVPGAAGTSIRQSVINGSGFNTSRFGLKGSEDLGGGLKANFLLESGFDVSTGAANSYRNPFTPGTASSQNQSAVFGRQSWVGVSGAFGEAKLGKMWTPYDDVKGLGAAAFDANIFAPANNVWLSNSYEDRPGNAIYYATPDISGFSAAAMYAFGENKTSAPAVAGNAGNISSFNVKYAGGPVAVALAYQAEKRGGVLTAEPTTKFTQLNASYDFGVAKLLAAAGNVKNVGHVDGKATEYQIGVDVPLGSAFTVSGGYARSKLTDTGAAELTSRGFGLAAKYDMSKRTFLYAGVQTAKIDVPALGNAKNETYAVVCQNP